MDYADPEQLEQFLLARVREKTEKDKLDLKRELKGWDRPPDKAAQMNIVRLVNAFANTSSDEYDDHGFLIFGADKADGDITADVPVLRTKGEDKLHAEIGQRLEGYLYPVPQFEIYRFERNGLTWGAMVIKPMRQGPSIFITEYDGLKVGDWRVRKLARAAQPTSDDYRRMQQGWTRPLEQRIRELEREVAGYKGELRAREEAFTPALKIEPAERSFLLKHRDAAVRKNTKVFEAELELQSLASSMHEHPRTKQIHADRAERTRKLGETKTAFPMDENFIKVRLKSVLEQVMPAHVIV
ncbi:hypothetical protein [Deinococcus navajonensis]|uniref:DNA-binding protein n=1 Tax=Deinococcus navajonensis TaxID=309884 RepID=A0ABV8XKP4_9DEIO